MLYLTRKVGESVVINDDIEVTVVEVRGKSIKLGFNFPADATVLRREIFDRIQEENRAAADGSTDADLDAIAPRDGTSPGTETGGAETGVTGKDSGSRQN